MYKTNNIYNIQKVFSMDMEKLE